MKKLILFIGLVILASTGVNGQQLFKMVHSDLEPITVQSKSGEKQTLECNQFSLLKRVILPLVGKGVTDYAYIEELVLTHNDQSSAKIKLVISVCPKFYSAEPQAYFVSLVFYDKNREPLFGHNFVADYGKTTYDVHTGLQATSMRAVEDVDCFTLFGDDVIAIHHNFLNDPSKEESDPLQELVEPISTVSVRMYALGER